MPVSAHGYGPGWASCENCSCDFEGTGPLCDGCWSCKYLRVIEGVVYYRFEVRFQLADGRRRVWKRWAPAKMYARESVARELADRFGLNGVKPRSCSIEAA